MKMKCKKCEHTLRPEWEWAWVAHVIKGTNVRTLERMCYPCLVPESDKWESFQSISKWGIESQEDYGKELYLVQD